MINSINLETIEVKPEVVLQDYPTYLINNKTGLVFTDTEFPDKVLVLGTNNWPDQIKTFGRKIVFEDTCSHDKYRYYDLDLKVLLKKGCIKAYKINGLVKTEELENQIRINDDTHFFCHGALYPL
jgi:hypothetical protein